MAEMEHKQLSEWIRILRANALERTNDCPDDHDLAALVDGCLHPETTGLLRLHLADCDFCTAQAGLLKQLDDFVPEQKVDEFVLARARRMGRGRQVSRIRYASRWATAAIVVLAVALVFEWNSPVLEVPEITNSTSNDPGLQIIDNRQTRNLGPDGLRLRVLTPSNGAVIDPDGPSFSWTGLSGSLYYDARIVTDEGDLVWQARVEDTELVLPGHLQLKPETEYFFRVDAHLASAKSISSQHVLFSIGEQH